MVLATSDFLLLFLSVCLAVLLVFLFFFFSSRRRHTRCLSDWSSDVCSSDLGVVVMLLPLAVNAADVPATKRVLLLHQAGGPGTFRGRFDVAFVEALRSGEPIRSEERRVGKECGDRGRPSERTDDERMRT